MAILTTGNTFADGDQVTSTKENNQVNAAAFVAGSSGTTDDSTLEVNGSGRLAIKDLGIGSGQLGASAVTSSKIQSSVALVTPLLGTPTSGVLTNCTGLPTAGLTQSSATTGQFLQWSGTAWVAASGIILSGETASTSGTAVDFTSIPAWANKVIVNFRGVSCSASSEILVRIGDSGGIENTGYAGASTTSEDTTARSSTGGFNFAGASPISTDAWTGSLILVAVDSTRLTWVGSGTVSSVTGTVKVLSVAGQKTLSAELDRVRILWTSGSSFDAGAISISYE